MNKKESICGFLFKFADKINLETMNKRLLSVAMLFSVVLLLASCLKDDNSDASYYDDTAITAFSLGTLNRYQTTLSSKGVDSVYKTTITGSQYAFSIDQNNALVYNVDSLPYGTDVTKVVCNITAKNSGIVLLKSKTSDSLSVYDAADSIDFSVPREFRVFSNAQSQYRSYIVKVNAHQEEADSFKWSSLGTQSQLAALTAMKAVVANGKVYLFGVAGGNGVVYSTTTSSGTSWTKLSPNIVLGVDAYKNVSVYNNVMYMLHGTNLLSSTDGVTWNTIAALGSNAAALLSVSSAGCHVLGSDANMYVVKHGETQLTAEVLDAANTYLPTQDWNGVILVSSSTSRENVLIVGNRSATTYASDANAVIWSKVLVNSTTASDEPWSYYVTNSSYALPRLDNLQVVAYDGGLLAFGGAGIGASTQTAFSQMYYSVDAGLTWRKHVSYQFPKGFGSDASSFAMTVDADNFIWIVCGQTGQVWKGRKNSAGWASAQTLFTE